MASLFNYLEYLRSKPEEVRRQVAFWASVAITGIILILWFVNLRFTASSPVNSPPAVAIGSEKISFWRRVGLGITEGRLRIKEGWQTITQIQK